jgi:PPOX class probable F420-dependent enzyme
MRINAQGGRPHGSRVDTPVCIAFDGERAFFRSYDRAWKTKRLRRNPRVEVAASTVRGKPMGPAIRARAALLVSDEAEIAARAWHGATVRRRGAGPRCAPAVRVLTMNYEFRSRPT